VWAVVCSKPEPKILNSILEHIGTLHRAPQLLRCGSNCCVRLCRACVCAGNTPLVRINNITKAEGIECEVCMSHLCFACLCYIPTPLPITS
jgi:hypothetical protein